MLCKDLPKNAFPERFFQADLLCPRRTDDPAGRKAGNTPSLGHSPIGAFAFWAFLSPPLGLLLVSSGIIMTAM